MAFLFKHPQSQYWYAGWKDENGKRVNRSTKVEAKRGTRKKAQKIADSYEDTAKQNRTARQVRQTIIDLHQDITGRELPSATVREYCAQFEAMKAGESSKATKDHYRNIVIGFTEWLRERADADMNDIRPADMAAYRNHLLTKVTEVTATKKMKGLRTIFATAHREGVILEDPTTSMRFSRKGKSDSNRLEKRPFTLDELKLIREETDGEWHSMLMFGLYTGQRMGDLATLRWSNVDLLKAEMRIATRKTGRTVTIPLAAPLLKHVQEMPSSDDPTGYVHPELADTYENKGASGLSNQFASILARCGLRDAVSHRSKKKGRGAKRKGTGVSFHCLRATAVTMLHEAGIPAATVEEWVGHDSAEVHRAYVKIGRESLQKASDALPEL
ncbi:MAG: tyrosine-type recombinase/integrase [Akkermansiaceae bacterium]|nr:tyrosine-type recombinase/integrase [Akkermansiaceae bacterium]